MRCVTGLPQTLRRGTARKRCLKRRSATGRSERASSNPARTPRWGAHGALEGFSSIPSGVRVPGAPFNEQRPTKTVGRCASEGFSSTSNPSLAGALGQRKFGNRAAALVRRKEEFKEPCPCFCLRQRMGMARLVVTSTVLRLPFIETDASQGAGSTMSGYDILPRIQGHAHAKPTSASSVEAWACHTAPGADYSAGFGLAPAASGKYFHS
jgi:hypothetical protein